MSNTRTFSDLGLGERFAVVATIALIPVGVVIFFMAGAEAERKALAPPPPMSQGELEGLARSVDLSVSELCARAGELFPTVDVRVRVYGACLKR